MRLERADSPGWHHFMGHYKDQILACDFFTSKTIRLQTSDVFFCIEIGTRRVHIAGITSQPTQRWVAQHPRQLLWTLNTQERRFTHVLRDNDGKYGPTFDAVFESEGIEVVRTPFRAPRANAYAERWLRSVREECLDRVIILDHRHLGYVGREYEPYFNTCRGHFGRPKGYNLRLNGHSSLLQKDSLNGMAASLRSPLFGLAPGRGKS